MNAIDITPRTNRHLEAQLTDLAGRAERAMAYAEDAEAAGDGARLHQAMRRYFLRLAQMTFLQQRPADARCPACEQGEAWQVDADCWQSGGVMVCLDHAAVWVQRDADAQFTIWKGEA